VDELDDILHLVHDTSLVVSQAMTVCAARLGGTPALWHHKGYMSEDVDPAIHVCTNDLEATFMALNRTCHELVEDIDNCETTNHTLPAVCVLNLEATMHEVINAEIDVKTAIEECKPEEDEDMDGESTAVLDRLMEDGGGDDDVL
jgi:hypothetical protein